MCSGSYRSAHIHGVFICTLHSRTSNNVSYDSCMSLTVIVFNCITIIIHQNCTGKIRVCFIQPIQTSPDFLLAVCLFRPIAAQVKVMHDDESMLVLVLPLRLHCSALNKKSLYGSLLYFWSNKCSLAEHNNCFFHYKECDYFFVNTLCLSDGRSCWKESVVSV